MSRILAAGAARMKLEAENYEARIAALEAQLAELVAENERLKQELAATQEKLIKANDELIQRRAEALSRTGAVKQAADIAYQVCAETRHVRLGDKCRDAILSALEPAASEGKQEHEHIEVTDAGLLQFADWFRKNYPGPDTIIHKPDWHAPKIYRAARHAMRQQEPKGQQPVAWASVKDRLPEVGSKFVLLYDDGSGASLYFRHDSGYIDADGDECDALDENRMWAYLPAGFEFWCEGASEPITLPKWRGPLYIHPSEQAVTEAMVEAGAKAIVACRFEDESEPVSDYDLELSRAALKAAMEAGHD